MLYTKAIFAGALLGSALLTAGAASAATVIVSSIGSPFSQCAATPKTLIYPDRIDPDVAEAILRRWE